MQQANIAKFNNSEKILASLRRRNFFITILRIIFPAFGLLLLAYLIVQIILDNISAKFDLSGVRVKSDRLIIDNPEYGGVMNNGTKYFVKAKSASTPIGGSEKIDLFFSELKLIRKDNYQMDLSAKNAILNIEAQSIKVKDLLKVKDDKGMRADLYDSTINLATQTLLTEKKVFAEFSDGSVLRADNLIYNGGEEIWNLTNVTLLVPYEGEEGDG